MTNPLGYPDNSAVSLHQYHQSIGSGQGGTADLLASISRARQDSNNVGTTEDIEDAEARDVANKFESLLIHNMLKSMRKTTLSEGKSNDRAIYDDMLDERLAQNMIDAGGIGIADQIVEQIRKQQGRDINTATSDNDSVQPGILAASLRRLPSSMSIVPDNTSVSASTRDSHLSMAENLWTGRDYPQLTQAQQSFIQPLLAHAHRNAKRLGTTPEPILAIAALETGWGRSVIKGKDGQDSHNLFGIKASGSDNRYATTLTTEYIEGSPQKLEARFKTFANSADAVDGFANFILANPRYSEALKHTENPERFLQELQRAGYATDPRYAEKAISIMHQIAGKPQPL